jgi:hypothetical protein
MIDMEVSSNIRERLQELTNGSINEIQSNENKDYEDRITELVSEYEATRVTLAECEYELELMKLRYDSQFISLKEQLMEDGYKSTEAKEHANEELTSEKMDLLTVEKDISLLKANMHSIEYQLRLKFQQIKNLIDLEVSIDETQV